MTLFYSNKPNTLSLDESNHCLRTLRKKINDTILITQGNGVIYRAKIIDITNNVITYQNIKLVEKKKKKVHIHIAIAPPKNRTRFEWFLEKVTEIGVDIISPVICENSERRKINYDRSKKIIISAMKQSKNSFLPIINKPIPFNDIIKKNTQNSYIAHCYQDDKKDFKNLLLNDKKIHEVTLFIGPEGDFSKKELNFAINMGITPVTLGESRFRTETAGIIGCNMINLLA